MTSPLSRQELRESFKHLFTSYESDLEEGLRLVDRYAKQVEIEAKESVHKSLGNAISNDMQRPGVDHSGRLADLIVEWQKDELAKLEKEREK